jgi:hypothetical protein
MMTAPLRVLLVAVVLGFGLRRRLWTVAVSTIVARRLHSRRLVGPRRLVHRVAILIDLDLGVVSLSRRGAGVRALRPIFPIVVPVLGGWLRPLAALRSSSIF